MLLLFVKSQLSLFDAPVNIAAHVRKDGTVVKPHVRIQKVKMHQMAQPSLFGHQEAPEPKKRATGKLDSFIAKRGGPKALAATIRSFTPEQQEALIRQMAVVGGQDVEKLREVLGLGKPVVEPEAKLVEPVAEDRPVETVAEVKPEPVPEPEPVDVAQPDPAHEIIEHTTGRGKVLRGIVRKDITGHQAAAIDPYTFRKDGGWFIREKHLEAAAGLAAGVVGSPAATAPAAEVDPEAQARAEAAALVEKSKAQAAKLRAAGEKVLADATEEYKRDRNTNTARRARMASGAEAVAANNMRIGQTMMNLANAIEDGEARHLQGISSKAAVVMLDNALASAMRDADRNLSYADQQSQRGRSPTMQDVRLAQFPVMKWPEGQRLRVLAALEGKRKAAGLLRLIRGGNALTPEIYAGLSEFYDAKVKYGETSLSNAVGWYNVERMADMNRWNKLGIHDTVGVQAALAEYLNFRDGHKTIDPVKAAERALVGKKVGLDFFPTPKALAASMAEAAGIKPGMRVLEPSAGNGHLADAAKDMGGAVDTLEISDTLRNVLTAKGHNIVAFDFEAYEAPEKYDAVIMNPPFSDRKDAAHIMRAWDMLKPGGKLVAIAGEGVFFGSDKKAVAFREWLAEQGAEVEQLPEGTFKGNDLPAQTGANARLIKITKKAAAQPVVDEETLRDVGLLYEVGGQWKYKFSADGKFLYANSKEDAVERATKTYHETPPEKRLTRDQRYDAANAAEYEYLHQRYGHLSMDRLESMHAKMGGDIESLRAAGAREFNGNGGRRTGAAVANEGARGTSEERMKLGRYIDERKKRDGDVEQDTSPKEGDRNADGLVFRDGRWHRDDEAQATPEPVTSEAEPVAEAAPAQNPEVEDAEDREDLASAMANDPHSEATKQLIEKVAAKRVRAATPVSDDKDDPNSPSYRWRDTGYIAGSRKEEAAGIVIQRAKKDGAQVTVQSVDWEDLERNPREAKELIVKSNLFGKVQWDALREGGMEPGAGFLIDRVYAAIGTEPSEDSPQARKDYTLGLQSLRARLEECKTAQNVLDTLAEVRAEYEGNILTAEESDAYKALHQKAFELSKQVRELDNSGDGLYAEANKLRAAAENAKYNLQKRKHRGWKVEQSHLDDLAAADRSATAAWDAWHKKLSEVKPEAEALRSQIQGFSAQAKAIQEAAYARNKIENPLHRAWNTMGERFIAVLRYRSYKGSEAFAKHVATVNAGVVKDWSWAETDKATKAPRIKKESIRFQMKVADTFDRKGGREVSIDSSLALKDKFGLRDVQSGNWVLQDPVSAGWHMQKCAEAMTDLADLIGIPVEQVSFNGRLAVAFGARGKGGKNAAVAHYDGLHRVINMTKMKGGGALAHELFHAWDNMVKEAATGEEAGMDDFATENPSLMPAGPLRDAFQQLHDAMHSGEHQSELEFNYSASDYRMANLNLKGERLGVIASSIVQAGTLSAALEKIDGHFARFVEKRGKMKTQKEQWRKIAIAHYGGNPDGGVLTAKHGPKKSSFSVEAGVLDGESGKEYWSETREMAARAFQAWVEDRMAGMGRTNDYLSWGADNKYHVDPETGMEWKPFPEGEERERINKAFDNLMAVFGEQQVLAKAAALW